MSFECTAYLQISQFNQVSSSSMVHHVRHAVSTQRQTPRISLQGMQQAHQIYGVCTGSGEKSFP